MKKTAGLLLILCMFISCKTSETNADKANINYDWEKAENFILANKYFSLNSFVHYDFSKDGGLLITCYGFSDNVSYHRGWWKVDDTGLTVHFEVRGEVYETTYRSYIIEEQEEDDFTAILYHFYTGNIFVKPKDEKELMSSEEYITLFILKSK